MKRMLLVLLVSCTSLAAFSQDEPPVENKGFDRSKLFGGGNFALSFGNNTIVNISPQLGYRFNRFFAAGVGVNALYSSFRSIYATGGTASRTSYGVVGANVFGRVYPIEFVFLQAQPEANYVWGKQKYYNPEQEYRLNGKIVPSLLLGAGGAIPMGGTGAFIVMAQYDVLQNERTPYGSKIFINFGYNFGF
ncbi:MAG: hypothetical protein EOO02_04765 [Chitinophagaceae bacterium]|nr:MAG: hypothetical protein EOO02_04765 [Chitinophagaceae bacterium]